MLQGTPGVSTSYDMRGDGITIRGFGADTGDIYRDGIRESGQVRRSTANIERIEILKGPASVLYGRSAGGGVVNMVSKFANFDSKSSVGAYAGSYDNYGTTADINQVLNDNLAVRLTGEYGESGSFRSGIENKIEMFSPSFTYKNDDGTLTWTTQYTYDKLGRVPDRGPSRDILPAGTSIKMGFAQDGDYVDDILQVVRTDVNYQYAPDWNFHWAASYRQAEQNFDHFYFGTYCGLDGKNSKKKESIAAYDVVLMRKDPPFDMNFVYTTYVLEQAEREGSWIINKPQSLRDCNEKLFATQFPELQVPTLVTSQQSLIREFIKEHGDVIVKPLDGMGGMGIFRLYQDGVNIGSTLEMLTELGTRPIMAQRYIPEIVEGDKRILMVNGEPVPYCLARIPQNGEVRGNLAAGGLGQARPLTENDKLIAAKIGPFLREKGLVFVGLDVIGNYVTEINVTSPTCIREIDAQFGTSIADDLFDVLEAGRTA